MIRKYLSTIVVALFLAVLGVIGAVFAYFSSNALSTGNTISTGEMTILLSDADETKLLNVSDSWDVADLIPGNPLPQTKLDIFNTSRINAHHIDIAFSYTGSDSLARAIIFTNANNGFRYGSSSDSNSVNLNTTLRGTTDTDYTVLQGANGLPFTAATVDGIDGTTPDSMISLSELAAFGKIRIQPGEESGGISANSMAELWMNAIVANSYDGQGETLDMQISFTLDQSSSQY